jgi:hypothetical protein
MLDHVDGTLVNIDVNSNDEPFLVLCPRTDESIGFIPNDEGKVGNEFIYGVRSDKAGGMSLHEKWLKRQRNPGSVSQSPGDPPP